MNDTYVRRTAAPVRAHQWMSNFDFIEAFRKVDDAHP